MKIDFNKMKLAQLEERIKKSLLKQKAISSKYGFDIKKHWKDMQDSLSKEK